MGLTCIFASIFLGWPIVIYRQFPQQPESLSVVRDTLVPFQGYFCVKVKMRFSLSTNQFIWAIALQFHRQYHQSHQTQIAKIRCTCRQQHFFGHRKIYAPNCWRLLKLKVQWHPCALFERWVSGSCLLNTNYGKEDRFSGNCTQGKFTLSNFCHLETYIFQWLPNRKAWLSSTIVIDAGLELWLR